MIPVSKEYIRLDIIFIDIYKMRFVAAITVCTALTIWTVI